MIKKPRVTITLLPILLVFWLDLVQSSNLHLNAEQHMNKRMANYLSLADPREITLPRNDSNGTYLTHEKTGGAFETGWYKNTTNYSHGQHYTYMWRLACAWLKWTPANQLVAANKYLDETNSTMRLSRYGIIGWDSQCYWGLIGIQWLKPLPIYQFKFNRTQSAEPEEPKKPEPPSPEPEPKPEPPKEPQPEPQPEPPKEPEKPEKPKNPCPNKNCWAFQPHQNLALGFPGDQKVTDQEGNEHAILQLEDWGASNTWFQLLKIVEGPYKDDFIIAQNSSVSGDGPQHERKVLDILDDTPKEHQYIVKREADYSVSQIWKLSAPHGVLHVTDHSKKWCLTRFNKYKDTDEVHTEYMTTIQLSKCDPEDNNQMWWLQQPDEPI